MNIDKLMKRVKSKLRTFLWVNYFVEIVYAIASSVLIVNALSGMISAMIERESREEIARNLVFFCCISTGIIFLAFIKKLITFQRTRKTAYEIENETYDYFFSIRYYDTINKDEMQAYITRSLIEYNSLYFTTVNEAVRVGVTVAVSVGYAVSVTPCSIIAVLFIAGLLLLILRGKLEKVPEIRENITRYNNELYRNLWEGIENLEIERFLNPDAVFEHYRENTRMLVDSRIEYNKIAVRADFLTQFGNILSVVLMVLIGIAVYGFRGDSISRILPLVLIIPNISAGIFAIPGLLTNKRNIKGIGNFLNAYFVFGRSDEGEPESDGELQAGSVKVDHMVFSYDGREKILDGVSLEFMPGNITTIVGENGCGKSTLLKLCALLMPVQEGEIRICNEGGADLVITSANRYAESARKKYWKQVYYMDASPRIIPASLEKNIILNDPYEEERYQDALRKAGLNDFEERDFIDVHRISDGEAQKIAFARIFYHHYRVIFLDESTSHMDPQTEETIMGEFQKLVRKERVTVVAVSHKDSFNCYSDAVYQLEQGKMRAVIKEVQ